MNNFMIKAQIIAVIFVISAILFALCTYIVDEREQVIVTQFGRPIGEPVTEAGIIFKIPFIQEVKRMDKRFLAWDGPKTEMSTKDKRYLIIDTYARWRIKDPMKYFLTVRGDELEAKGRLEDILGSATRSAVAMNSLIEIIRTTKGRVPLTDMSSDENKTSAKESNLEISSMDISLGELSDEESSFEPIEIGREKIEGEIYKNSYSKLEEFGIELLDVRFKRINYNDSVLPQTYGRMVSERQKIAKRFRSEGEAQVAIIGGLKEKVLQEIASKSYKKVQEIQGEADANASSIYAGAYNQSEASRSFYNFLKTTDSYSQILDEDTSLLLSTDSPLFQLFKSLSSTSAAAKAE